MGTDHESAASSARNLSGKLDRIEQIVTSDSGTWPGGGEWGVGARS